MEEPGYFCRKMLKDETYFEQCESESYIKLHLSKFF